MFETKKIIVSFVHDFLLTEFLWVFYDNKTTIKKHILWCFETLQAVSNIDNVFSLNDS
jgi:hypothetical protein